MNVVLWIVQGLLALAFLGAGGMKLARPKEALIKSGLGWAADFADNHVKLIGAAEVLGAIGLILPQLTRIAPVLTPIAALGLAIAMAGAIVVHVRRKEQFVAPLVLGVLALFVAIMRFGAYPS